MVQEKIRTSVLFRIYYYQAHSAIGKEEGVIRITDERGKLTNSLPEEHFNNFKEIPELMRTLLEKRRLSAPPT